MIISKITSLRLAALILAGGVLTHAQALPDAPTVAPAITSLSATTLAQAGRLRITGTGFGAAQGTGVVTIGGANAPVSSWTDKLVTAYVSDGSPLGANSVQVSTAGGTSNALTLQVTARPAAVGQVLWRFQADGYTIRGRPAVGSDGTIYTADTAGHLYALTPTGGLKWIFNAGPADVEQPVSIGPEGTIYFANIFDVYAVNPDGTLKWVLDTGATVFAGPTAGPDGNIYGANADVGFSAGLGAFVLSSSGNVISNLKGFSTRSGYNHIEVVFGPTNQWYFANNASGAVTNAGALYAFPLGSTSVIWFQGAEGQARVQPSGNIVVGDGNGIHPGLADFSSSGALVWRSLGELPGSVFPGTDAQSATDVGPDGMIYLDTLKFGTGWSFTSLNTSGTLRWQFFDNNIATNPAVNQQNTAVVYSAAGFDQPSHVNALAPATGALLWSEMLPKEGGGNIQVSSTPRFSIDGSAVYAGTVVNAPDTYCYLYAFSVAGSSSTDTVSITSARYTTSRQQLKVSATTSDPTATLQVFTTSTDTLIGTLKKKRTGVYSGTFTLATNPLNITVKSSSGGTASAAVTAR